MKNNSKVAKLLQLTLLLSSMMTIMANAVIAPALPLITQSFAHLANAAILSKMIMSVPALTIAIASPFMGLISDKWGRRPVLIISMLIYAAAGSTGYYIENLPLILFFRFIFGFGVAGIMTSLTALIGDYFEMKERSHFLGLQGSFMAIGGIVFISGSGFLADINWHYTFLIYLFSLPILLLVLLFVKEPKSIKVKQANQSDDEYPKKMAWIVYISVFIAVLFFYLLPVQSPFLLATIKGMPYAYMGLLMSAGTLAQAVFALFYGRMRSRFTNATIYAFCCILLGIGYTALSFSTEIWHCVVSLFIVGAGISWIIPNANFWILTIAPSSQRGKLSGRVATAVYMGQFLCPVFIQPFSHSYGIAGSFRAAAIMLGVLSMGFLLLSKWLKNRIA